MVSGRSVRSICLDDDMPCMSTVFKWLREQEGFSQQYARASVERGHVMAEEAIDIADDSKNDYIDVEGVQKLNNEHVQRSRLRVDTRKWFASKLAPKVYGDKLALGGDADAGPIQVSWQEPKPTTS
jgi:hypothetical protein